MLAVLLTVSVSAASRSPHRLDGDDLRPSGEASISCVNQSLVRETRVRDDRTIDFYMRGRKVYRNILPSPCPQLGFERAFAHTTSTNNYCSVDTITVIQTGVPIPGATCGLGEFEPMVRVGTGVSR